MISRFISVLLNVNNLKIRVLRILGKTRISLIIDRESLFMILIIHGIIIRQSPSMSTEENRHKGLNTIPRSTRFTTLS